MYAIIGILAALIMYALVWPWAVEQVTTRDVIDRFDHEFGLLAKPIADLGVTAEPVHHFECFKRMQTHWQAKEVCSAFVTYRFDTAAPSASTLKNYTTNANKLATILQKDGWVQDRPQDKLTLTSINPYSSANDGEGGEMPYHKNIGPISCNLEVTFDSLNFPQNPDPGALNINGFSCSKTVQYLMPSLGAHRHYGP